MRRYFGAILIGLGALLLVMAVGLPLYVGPAVAKLPYNMQGCPDDPAKPGTAGCLRPSVAEAENAIFLDAAHGKIEHGTLRSTTWVRPQAKITADLQKKNTLTDDSIVWDVYSNAVWVQSGAVMSAYSTELALDRVSGAAVKWNGQWLDENSDGAKPNNVAYDGQVYKFPFGTEKKDYRIFDSNLRRALPAKYIDTVSVKGLQAYHFRQVIEREQVQNVSEDSLKAALGLFAPNATSGKIVYSNIREVWVDPATGAYVDVREQQKKVLVPADGTDGETTLLDTDFRYTKETIDNSVKSATDNGVKLQAATVYAPIGAGVLGFVFVVIGLLMVRSKRHPVPASARQSGGGDTGGMDDSTGLLSDRIPPASASWPQRDE